MDFSLTPAQLDLQQRTRSFIADKIIPFEKDPRATAHGPTPELRAELVALARSTGLLTPHASVELGGLGLSHVDKAIVFEEAGYSTLGPTAMNIHAPDEGNIHLLEIVATEAQKERWLRPQVKGLTRSCFAMTEPGVASSDATNIRSAIVRDGDHYVINGHKWWISGAGDPRCKVAIFMGQTSPVAAAHQQQSMILVPMDTPGIEKRRMLPVFGFDDAPHGHAELVFTNVRVPAANMLLGEGRGFEIAQGRLGPGRIHHCLRLIGCAERALEAMSARVKSRVAFGKPLAEQGTIRAALAESRIEIEQARLLTMKAAELMDTVGNKAARREIAMIKVVVPRMAAHVIDRAIQAHGAGGVSNDFSLAAAWAYARTIRLADGPDEVHIEAIAKMELK